MRLLWAALLLLPAFGASAGAVLTSLFFFNGTDGASPLAGLVQGSDGYFYGTTEFSGNTNLNYGLGYGTVFKISPSGALTNLYDFGTVTNEDGDPLDGLYPDARLVQGSDGYFYGTTQYGGNINLNGGYGFGTVFKISPSGAFSSLFSFTGGNGDEPGAALVQGSDGYFYGTTYIGGNISLNGGEGWGTVFKINPSGAFTSLYSFNGIDGEGPVGLVQGSDGYFYGTTQFGGNINLNGGYGWGTVFKISPSGAFTSLFSFNGSNGGRPNGLVQGSDGYFYGTTQEGGTSSSYYPNWRYGTVFKISPDGALTTLYDFGAVTNTDGAPLDGAWPQAGLVHGSDGYFYGTTAVGGSTDYNGSGAEPYGFGTLFQISLDGAFTSLFSFNGSNGRAPNGLVQGSDSNFYGTTYVGGANNNGTVFRLTLTELPDLIATSLDWNTNEGESGLVFAYSLQGSALTNSTEAALFWADGTNESNIITNTPIYDEPIPADFAVGTTNEVQVAASYLANPPSGAIYLLLVLDPNHLITEANTNNNTLALAYSPLEITIQPTNQSVLPGTNVVFTVAATGTEPLQYQWQLDGKDLEDTDFGHISGATDATLTITDVTANDAGTYSVVVSNDGGKTNSEDATLTVLIAPKITTQPINRLVIQGSNAVFTVEAAGTDPLNYQWLLNGTNLAGDPKGHISGATSETLEINEVETNDAGTYSVVVTNAAGFTNSVVVTLTVAGMQSMVPASEYNALLDFYNATVGTGWKDHSGWLDGLSAEWYGVEVTNLQFDLENNFILNSGTVREISLETNGLSGNLPGSLNSFSGLETLNLSSNQLKGSIPGVFAFLTRLQAVDLSSNQLTGAIPTGFGSLSLTLKTLDLSANDLGGGLPFDLRNMAQLETLDLSHNGLTNSTSGISLGIMNNLTLLDLSDNSFSGGLTNVGIFAHLQSMDLSGNQFSGTIPVASGFFLSLNAATLQHLDLSANNLGGNIPNLGAYTLLEELDLSGNQLTGSIPADFNNLVLLQSLDLSQNNLTNAIPNLGELSQLKTLNLSSNNLSGSIPASLLSLHQLQTLNLSSNHFTGNIFQFLSPLQSLQIQLNDLDFITNSAPLGVENNTYINEMLNNGIDVTNLPQNGPSIVSDPQDESVTSGGPDPFSVAVQGAPLLYYQWQHNNTNLSDGARIIGSLTTNLSINPVQASDQGSYQVIITNAYGSITSDFAMLTVTTVGVKPQITSPATNQSITVGQNASFSVTATGSTPLHYQWFFDGSKMAGATKTSVAITDAALTNAGFYSVLVTNAYGTASNLVGTLSVTTAPLSFATNGAAIQYTNGMVVLQITGLTGTGTAEVQVSSNLTQWVTISTNSAASGTIQVIDTGATNTPQGFYRVVVFP
jgi:uncharacterized repeat protein (TIGR03803 family)